MRVGALSAINGNCPQPQEKFWPFLSIVYRIALSSMERVMTGLWWESNRPTGRPILALLAACAPCTRIINNLFTSPRLVPCQNQLCTGADLHSISVSTPVLTDVPALRGSGGPACTNDA